MAVAADDGVDLIATPTAGERLRELVKESSVVLPSPGVGDHHPVFAVAAEAGVEVRGEFDLAKLWDSRPLVAITGTNGKTTVTTIVTDALNRSGIAAVAAGNTDVPLVVAIDDPHTETFVVEASSFRLGHSHDFSPAVAAWLNFSPDHLDAHASLDAYERAKAKIWSHLQTDAIAVANAEDAVVMAHTAGLTGSVVTFGKDQGDWRWENDKLIGPQGPLLEVRQLQLRRPHDLLNAAAVSAIATSGGASAAGIVSALSAYEGMAHRTELVGTFGGVAWVNDSKATVPQATLAAVEGYQSVVLIAGGKNKGISLHDLASLAPKLRAVVAMGDARDEIADVFSDLVELHTVAGIPEAIEIAGGLARPGDTVLLSPACTSFDAYTSYVERGDHFRRLVTERFA